MVKRRTSGRMVLSPNMMKVGKKYSLLAGYLGLRTRILLLRNLLLLSNHGWRSGSFIYSNEIPPWPNAITVLDFLPVKFQKV